MFVVLDPYLNARLTLVFVPQLHEEQEPGGVLVFLPGQDDIESLQLLLEENLPYITGRQSAVGDGGGGSATKRNVLSQTVVSSKPASQSQSAAKDVVGAEGGGAEGGSGQPGEQAPTAGEESSYTVSLLQDFEVMALYAAMPPDEQLKVFTPPRPGVRRFILSTNIAETSVTISGIKYGKFPAVKYSTYHQRVDQTLGIAAKVWSINCHCCHSLLFLSSCFLVLLDTQWLIRAS
jgi:HrpA-like RNA helicase